MYFPMEIHNSYDMLLEKKKKNQPEVTKNVAESIDKCEKRGKDKH